MHASQCFHAIYVFQILYKGHGLLEWHKNKGLQFFNIFECHKLFKYFHQPSHLNIQSVISMCQIFFKHSNYVTCDIILPTLGLNISKFLIFNENKSYFIDILKVQDPFINHDYNFKNNNFKHNNRQGTRIDHNKYSKM